MAKKGSFSEVYDKNGDYVDVEAKRFDGTRTVQIQGDVTASQTWNGDSNTALTLNASIGAKKVTQDKIGDKAVGSGQMADGSVGLPQMAASAMTDTVSANNSKLVTSQGVNAAIAAATLNRGKDYGPLSVDEINSIAETIPTGSTVYVESLGASDAKVINDGYSDGTMASFSVEVGEDLKYYRSPDNSLHGWYSTEANVKIKQPANYSGGIAVDSAQDASSGSAGIEFIQSFKQNTNGDIRDIVKAKVDIVDSISSTRTNAAATPNSVKSAYDLANTANTGLANKLDKTGDGKDVTVSFSEASTRANIGTGEKLSVMFGKIKKWFTDLKALAFKDTVSDSDISGTISDNHIASASTWNGKADKVSGATNGNLAALDSNGNLTDSGKKAADFATAAQGSKADSAIQGVKVNGTTLTPDANKVVNVPLATTSADGAMSAADKTKLNNAATYTQSSGTAPVKVDAYGALTPVPMDSSPTTSSTNLMTSGDIKTALDGKVDSYRIVGASPSSADTQSHSWQKLLDIKLRGWSRFNSILFSNLDDTVPSGFIVLNVSRLADGIGAPTHISVDTFGRTEQNPSSRKWAYSYDSVSNSTIVYTHSMFIPNPRFRLLYNYNSNPQVVINWFSSSDSTSIPESSTEFDAYEHVKHTKGDTIGSASVPVYVEMDGRAVACTDTFVNNIEYVANQSGGGGSLNKTINGTTTSVLTFMNDSEAVAIWNDAKTAAANAS